MPRPTEKRTGVAWCSAMSTSSNSSRGGNPAHDQVWAKSVSEVPGKEVERWGVTVDMWAGIYEGGLDRKGYQHILEQALVPRAKALSKDQKVVGSCNKTKPLLTHPSQRRGFWSRRALLWWKAGPPRVTISTPWRTFGLSSTRDWSKKSSVPKNLWRKPYVQLGKC